MGTLPGPLLEPTALVEPEPTGVVEDDPTGDAVEDGDAVELDPPDPEEPPLHPTAKHTNTHAALTRRLPRRATEPPYGPAQRKARARTQAQAQQKKCPGWTPAVYRG
jgi:hypothetical protein